MIVKLKIHINEFGNNRNNLENENRGSTWPVLTRKGRNVSGNGISPKPYIFSR